MSPARWPRPRPLDERLLHIDPARRRFRDLRIGDLPSLLGRGDLVVVNDAATLPASLRGRVEGADIELRLLGRMGDGRFRAVLMGAGDWRARTEDRPPPPLLAPGARIVIGGAGDTGGAGDIGGDISRNIEHDLRSDIAVTIDEVSDLSPRLITIRFNLDGAALWWALYRAGRPVQYSYLDNPLELWHTQTVFAARPWAVEQPCAGRPLTAGLLIALRERGVAVAALTHAAGLSSTGDPAIDAALPLDEAYEISAATIDAIEVARAAGGRVIAIGTTVARALEGSAAENGGVPAAGAGVTGIRLGAEHRLQVVDGILTGMHEPGTSHRALMAAFAEDSLLDAAYAHAEAVGYLGHEFGDSTLVLADRRSIDIDSNIDIDVRQYRRSAAAPAP